jgi:uncharacterized membrane protein
MTILQRNWLVPVVLASLAANIFLAGIMIGQMHFMPLGNYGPHGMPLGPPGMLGDMEQSLGPADAKIFHETIMKNLPPPPDDFRKDLDAVQKILTSADFDTEAFRQALQHIHDQHTQMDTVFVQALTKAVSQVSPEGRARLAEALAHYPHTGPDGMPLGPH